MKRILVIIWFVYGLNCLWPAHAYSFPGSRIELFTIEEGLSQTGVNFILLDSKGYLWIATHDGLNRYDGNGFVAYRNNPADSNSIGNNFIRHLCEDSQGNIWVATNNGLSCYQRQNAIFLNYYNTSDKNSLSDNVVYSVFEDRNGNIWAKTLESLNKFERQKGVFTHFFHFNNVFNYISGDFFFDIYEDRYNKLWVGTKDGLNCFDKNLELFERFEYLADDKNSISNNRIKCIREDSSGELWIGTDNGLNRYDRLKRKFIRYGVTNGLPSNTINCITPMPDGTLWIGTMAGFSHYNPATNKFKSFQNLLQGNFNIQLTGVSSIVPDRSGLLWIGSYQGLIKIDLKPFKFELGKIKVTGFENASSVTAVLADSKNNQWFGTWGRGLVLKNDKGVLVQEFNSKKFPGLFPDDNVYAIFEDKNSNIWIGTGNGIAIYKNGRLENFKNINKSNAFLENNRINVFFQDHKGLLWIGSEHGLHTYNIETRVSDNYVQLPDDDGVQLQSVFSIIEDEEKNVWIGTDKGLLKYNPLQKNIKQYVAKRGVGNRSLSSNYVFSLLFTSDSVLWVGTNSGLCRYSKLTDDFEVYFEHNGLPNNLIYSLQEDKNGNIWLSTNKGLVFYNKNEDSFAEFDLADGLQSYEFNLGASGKTKNGQLLFGGIKGYNIFDPDSLISHKGEHIIEITMLEIMGKGVKQLVNIWPGREIRIPAGTNMFTISFALLDFTYPENNRYMYSLSSAEDDALWVNTGNKSHVNFSNLPAGNYIFKVKGANSDQVWSANEYTIKLKVESPFWESNLAIISYVILLAGIGYLTVQWRTRKLRKSNRELLFKEQASIKIAQQKEELTLKNKNITDSINYAKRIQVAMMPSVRTFRRLLPNSFVVHKPKDIVSGDFYWIYERGNKVFVAAVDCTGHGVPGAFMSILGVELFRKITIEEIEDPGKILSRLNEEFSRIFSDVEDISLKDGMDIAFCAINKNSNLLEFAGAFNPLYIIRDNKIIETKGNRFSVSMEKNIDELEFVTHSIPLQKNDMIYIFSDGYADQFGGYEGKKFKYRRFKHLLLNIHKLPMDDQKKYLEESMEAWKGNHEQVDDILVIGIKADF